MKYQFHGDGNYERISCPINVAVLNGSQNKLGEDMQRMQHKPDTAIRNKMIGLKKELQKDRELQRIEQLKANAEIRRRALQADQIQQVGRNNG